MSYASPPTLPLTTLLSIKVRQHSDILSLYAQHGPIIKTTPLYPQYFVNDPSAINTICRSHAQHYNKVGVGITRLADMLGPSLITHSDDSWQTAKKLWHDAFRPTALTQYHAPLYHIAKTQCAHWLNTTTQPTDILGHCLATALRMNLFCLTGQHHSADYHAISQQVTRAVNAGTRALSLKKQFANLPAWLFRKQARPLHQWADGLLSQTLQQPQNTGLIAPLITAYQASKLSKEALSAEFKAMLFAGYEATGTALAWLLYHLADHPDVYQHLNAELAQQACGHWPPSTAQWQQLTYTDCVIAESLRLSPPIYVFERRAKSEQILCGYRIPKGALLTISPYTVHRNPHLWPQPLQFMPERFARQNAHQQLKGSYLPYGLGPRSCIGMGLGRLMIKSCIAALHTHRLQPLASSITPLLGNGQITLKAKNGIHVIWNTWP